MEAVAVAAGVVAGGGLGVAGTAGMVCEETGGTGVRMAAAAGVVGRTGGLIVASRRRAGQLSSSSCVASLRCYFLHCACEGYGTLLVGLWFETLS
jgi:hypothetical protein